MALKVKEAAKAGVVKACDTGKCAFHYAEHGCALGYAVHEFWHVSFFMLLSSGALLIFTVLVMLDPLARHLNKEDK